jgi:hypothetical protein
VDYSKLKFTLETLEGRITSFQAPSFNSASEVRGIGAQVQLYGLDFKTKGKNLPDIVIAVGANYTQGKTTTPRDQNPPIAVEDNLSACRTNLDAALQDYTKYSTTWFNKCAASSPSLKIPANDKYHFVMTNFCMWITNFSWLNIHPQVRTDLLTNNPHFQSHRFMKAFYPHLMELIEVTNRHNVLWVGHGLGAEVFSLFRSFFLLNNISAHWVLVPNLSRPYDYVARPFLQ